MFYVQKPRAQSWKLRITRAAERDSLTTWNGNCDNQLLYSTGSLVLFNHCNKQLDIKNNLLQEEWCTPVASE